MEKWIFAKDEKPPADEELLCIFDSMAGEVWHAKREGEKYFGSCLDDDELQEINGQLVCWRHWPTSPFRGDA